MLRYSDFAIHPKYPYLLVCICEDHTHPEPSAVKTSLVTVNTISFSAGLSDVVSLLLQGADFYAAPTFSPQGDRLAWQQWCHPDMPWNGSEVHVASVSVESGKIALKEQQHVAGRWKEICAAFPAWVGENTLLFTCDPSGWHNPWKYDVRSRLAVPVLPHVVTEDFAMPQWALGMSFGALVGPLGTTSTSDHVHVEGSIDWGQVALYSALRAGRAVLYLLNLHSGMLEELECPYVTIEYVRRVSADAVVFLGAKTDAPREVVLCTPKEFSKPKIGPQDPIKDAWEALKEYFKPKYTVIGSHDSSKDAWKALFSKPEPLTLTIPETGEPLHVVFYPPTNPDYTGPEGEKPPCVVGVHGGPTGMADQAVDLTVQYFTSRGWAWCVPALTPTFAYH